MLHGETVFACDESTNGTKLNGIRMARGEAVALGCSCGVGAGGRTCTSHATTTNRGLTSAQIGAHINAPHATTLSKCSNVKYNATANMRRVWFSYSYLHFRRVIDAANLVTHLYNASTYRDRDRMTVLNGLNIRVDANLFTKVVGGMQMDSMSMERGTKTQTIFDMLLTVDRMGNPFIVAESMTIFVRGENKSTSTT